VAKYLVTGKNFNMYNLFHKLSYFKKTQHKRMAKTTFNTHKHFKIEL
jgi:hypothetical protein